MGSEKEVELSCLFFFNLTPERRIKIYRVESKTNLGDLVMEQRKIKSLL